METPTDTTQLPAPMAPLPPTFRIPNNWHPRPYQKRLFNFLGDGGKRAIAIWHRRAGKDDVALHYTACAALRRVGNYWHCLPEFEQGRRAIWTAINPHTGVRRIDEAFPLYMRESVNDQTMFIRFFNGSTWSVIGSDRYDATMGAAPCGIVYSEWALSNPSAWGYHRPILEENNGWALFITTPRGRNHAKTMYDMAGSTPGWFAELLAVDDTATLSKDQLAEALKEYIALFGRDVGVAQFEQEYQCNFNAAILGAYYALEMRDLRREKRIMDIEPDYDRPVHRAWDIGVRDDTAIWWFQMVGGQLFVLDVYSASMRGVDHYAEVIAERKARYGWKDGTDWVPHDAKVMEWGSGRTRIETMQRDFDNLNPLPVTNVSKLDGINALRRAFPLMVVHPRCEDPGLQALEQYCREWDDDLKAFKMEEKRNWATHLADAARYMALAWRALPVVKAKEPRPKGWVIPPPEDLVPRSGIIRI